MRRREFIALLGAATITVRACSAFAEPTGRMPEVAVLIVGNPDDSESTAMVSAFEQGMRTAEWSKDINVRLDYRRGGTDPQHAAAAAADVAAAKPDVVVAIGSPVVVAMQRLTSTIPIVFAVVSDPIGQGVVASLAHPGGNITGFSNLEPGIGGKWLELLKEMAPAAKKVAVMFNPATSPYNELFERSVEDGARTFGVQVSRAPVHDDVEMATAFERLDGQPDVGLLVPSDAFTYFRSAAIVALAAKYRLPAIYPFRRFVEERIIFARKDFHISLERLSHLAWARRGSGSTRCCSRRQSAPLSNRLLVPAGALPGLPYHGRRRPADARLAPRRVCDGSYPGAIVPILPAQCAVRRTRVPIEVERCRGVLRGAQRQSVGQPVSGDEGGGSGRTLSEDAEGFAPGASGAIVVAFAVALESDVR